MNNQKDQKDIEKTNINSYGHTNVSNNNLMGNKPFYEFVNKKTEKLVTALYMITDCIDIDDALRGRLRMLGVELLSDMYKLSTIPPMDKSIHIAALLGRIGEILSFVDIACTIGFISDMNGAILNREFKNLSSELQSHQSKDTHFTFTLSDSMFEVGKPTGHTFLPKEPIKDNSSYKGQIIKRTYVSSSTNNVSSQMSVIKGPNVNAIDKEERSQKILSFIKDKKNTLGMQSDLSIKDISIAFTDWSEKTIQRELNSLVSKGRLRKIGAKRWSRYQAL